MFRDIDIKDMAQVKKINRVASESPCEVWLSTGAVVLDARSLLGLYALIGQRVHVVTQDTVDPRYFGRMVENMQ